MTLEPVRRAMIDDAQAEADRALEEAERELGERLEAARRQAEEILAQAQAAGEEEDRMEAARELSRRRAEARMVVLGAERELYDELLASSRDAVLALRADPDYPELLQRLAEAAREALGPEAGLELDPPEAGGVRAHAGSRSVDYTLPALAGRCIAGLGGRLQRLWA